MIFVIWQSWNWSNLYGRRLQNQKIRLTINTFGGGLIKKKKLIKVLEERWTNNLPDFELFKTNIEDLRSNFDPRNFSDCELYLEKLIRIKDELKKKESKRHKRHKKNYPCVKPLRFWFSIFSLQFF